MTHAAHLGALMPRNVNVIEDAIPFSGTASPAIAELQALSTVEVALGPEYLDLDAVERSAQRLEARSFSDDLRLPPPPRRARTGAELQRRMYDSVATFRAKAQVPVAAAGAALEAEARLMAACEGLCRFQEQIASERQRPVGAIAQRVAGSRS